MSDPEEDEDDMPEDKDSTHSGEAEAEGDGDGAEDGESEVVVADVVVADVDRDGDGGETRGEVDEEDLSDDFFDAVKAPSSRATASPYARPRRAAKVKVAAEAAPRTTPSVP